MKLLKGRKQRQCSECGKRPPVFRVKGGPPKTDKTHTECRQCFEGKMESLRQQRALQQRVLS